MVIKCLVEFVPLPGSAGFDTLSGYLPAFPDYLAEKRMFIDWELIKRGPPLTLAPFFFAKGEGLFDVEAIYLSSLKNAFVVASALLLAAFRFDSYCHCLV